MNSEKRFAFYFLCITVSHLIVPCSEKDRCC